jgi:hypothetical protein
MMGKEGESAHSSEYEENEYSLAQSEELAGKKRGKAVWVSWSRLERVQVVSRIDVRGSGHKTTLTPT